MGFCGFALISLVTIVSIFRSFPLAARWPIHGLAEQVELVLGYAVEPTDGSLSSPVNGNSSTSSYITSNGFWPELGLTPLEVLRPTASPTAPTSTTTTTTSSTSEFEENLEEIQHPPLFELTTLPIQSYEMQPINVVAWLFNRYGPRSINIGFKKLLQSGLAPHDGVRLPYFVFWVVWIPLVLNCYVWLISTMRWVFTRSKEHRYRQIVNYEILELLREIQAKKAVLRGKIEIAASVIDHQIEELLTQIIAEKERVCTQFSAFLADEVNKLRERLQEDVRSEFEEQVSRVKDFITNLETVRDKFPDPKDFEALCQTVVDEVRRSEEFVDRLKKHFREIESSITSANIAQVQTESPVRYAIHVRPEVQQPVISTTSKPTAVTTDSCEKDDMESNAEVLDVRDNTGTQKARTFHLEWREAMRNHATRPQIEQGRKIRRERLEMRQLGVTSTPCQPSMLGRADRKTRWQRRSSRNKHLEVWT